MRADRFGMKVRASIAAKAQLWLRSLVADNFALRNPHVF